MKYLDVVDDNCRLTRGRFRTDGHHQVIVTGFGHSHSTRIHSNPSSGTDHQQRDPKPKRERPSNHFIRLGEYRTKHCGLTLYAFDVISRC